MADRILSTRELNRALLARQHLLEPADLPIPDVLDSIGGIQDQYAPAGYVGLWSRMRAFRRESLTEALEAREVIQATLMRSTIHLVSRPDYWPLAVATLPARRETWLRAQRGSLADVDIDAVVSRVRDLLGERPRRHREMLDILAAEGYPRIAWVTAAQLLDLVRIPPSGTWEQRRADLYGLAEDWLGPSTATEAESIELVVRRYLGGFGPAPLAGLANWAGIAISTLRPVVQRLELRHYRDEDGRVLVDLPDAPLPDVAAPAPVRFLPTWDATLLVHARRTRILPESYRPRVFNTKTPHSVPTFLVDGAIAGTWRHEKGRIELMPFHELSPGAQREVETEAARLAEFHA